MSPEVPPVVGAYIVAVEAPLLTLLRVTLVPPA